MGLMPSLRSLQTRARFRAVVAADVLARSAGALQRDEDLSPRAEDRAAASAWRHIELPEGLVHPVWRTPVSVLAVLPHAWREG